jgi:hypothetical protein
MPDLNIRGAEEALMTSLKDAAAKNGLTLRDFVLQGLRGLVGIGDGIKPVPVIVEVLPKTSTRKPYVKYWPTVPDGYVVNPNPDWSDIYSKMPPKDA